MTSVSPEFTGTRPEPKGSHQHSEFGSQSAAMLPGQVIHSRTQEPSPGDLVLP